VIAFDALRIVAAFLIGSVPTGYLLVRWVRGGDVRTAGSGNIGATNVYRTAGEAAGLTTFVLDAVKGILAVVACAVPGAPTPWIEAGAGLAAVLGHAYSPWLRGHGGKGVATAAGATAVLAPVPFAVAVAVAALVVAGTRVVSTGSLVAVAVFPVAAVAFREGSADVALGILLATVVFWWHRDNLRRLRKGQEAPIRRPQRG
jgi:glycerol-3-phosphate acyltransferase PlsY